MLVGTAGSVKGLAPWELERLAPEMVLANTYHLLLRPGVDTVEEVGGLHRFMAWDGPILTDSGGFQVFSLAQTRKIDDAKILVSGGFGLGDPKNFAVLDGAFGVMAVPTA
mgnify:CR=1 FL=1